MKPLDSYTVIMTYVIVNWVSTIILLMLWFRYGKRFKGIRYLFSAYIVQTIALFIALFESSLSPVLGVILPQIMVLVSLMLFIRGITRFVNIIVQAKFAIPYLTSFTVIYTYFNLVHLNINALIGWTSAFVIPLYLYLIYLLRFRVDAEHKIFTSSVRRVCELSVVLYFIRLMYAIFHTEIFDYYSAEAALDSIIFAFIQALLLIMTFAIVMMVVEKMSHENINEAKQLEEMLIKKEYLATTDALTGIYNRRKIETLINEHYRMLIENQKVFSILMIDIDHFKTVNDRFGHDVGDEVLVKLSNCLRDNIRGFDSVGRWGGEEFLIILGHIGKHEAIRTAERLRNKCAEITYHEKLDINLTISIGVIEASPFKSVHEMIKEADRMLYNAKADGRNTVCYEFFEFYNT